MRSGIPNIPLDKILPAALGVAVTLGSYAFNKQLSGVKGAAASTIAVKNMGLGTSMDAGVAMTASAPVALYLGSNAFIDRWAKTTVKNRLDNGDSPDAIIADIDANHFISEDLKSRMREVACTANGNE